MAIAISRNIGLGLIVFAAVHNLISLCGIVCSFYWSARTAIVWAFFFRRASIKWVERHSWTTESATLILLIIIKIGMVSTDPLLRRLCESAANPNLQTLGILEVDGVIKNVGVRIDSTLKFDRILTQKA